MTFGLTTTGFNPATLDDVKTALEAAFRAEFGNNVRVDAASVNGQIIGVFAEVFADLWETAEDTYAAGFVGSATGASLDDLVALAGITRNTGTFSTVTLTLTGTPTTLVGTGSQFRDPLSGTVWQTAADATIGGGGTVDVAASPSVTGPLIALAGTITEIVTPIGGVTNVTNALDSSPGTETETDAALRIRFIASFRSGGGSSDEAIRAVLLQVAGVSEAFVVSNRSNSTDLEGRPPHSLEAIVRGGVDQAVLDALWTAIPAGIEAYGVNVSGTVTDSLGNPQPVAFTRPTNANIWVEVVYEPDLGAVQSTIEAEAELEIINAGTTLNTGDDVVPFKFKQSIETGGFRRLAFFCGRGPGPTTESIVSIQAREIAVLDSTRVSFRAVAPGAPLV